jgi:hypothetical protein
LPCLCSRVQPRIGIVAEQIDQWVSVSIQARDDRKTDVVFIFFSEASVPPGTILTMAARRESRATSAGEDRPCNLCHLIGEAALAALPALALGTQTLK